MNEAVLPTTDLERARHNLDHSGYGVIKNLIPDELLGRVHARVVNVMNKGSEFLELLSRAAITKPA